MGLREARHIWNGTGYWTGGGSSADANTDKHLILLSAGEYRLPTKTPGNCFSYDEVGNCQSDMGCGVANESNDNRVCHARYFANLAKADGIQVSALQLGNEWKAPGEDVYGEQFCTNPPDVPYRGDFLKELAICGSQIGSFARIHPLHCFKCGIPDFQRGTPQQIADTIAEWMCEENYGGDSDSDGVDAICDNCPQVANADQRDCNRDGVGDRCQLNESSCGAGLDGDSDYDGLCDGLDTCDGGDDCVVAMVRDERRCENAEDCSCDCDHNGDADLCQAAQELPAYTQQQDFDAHDGDDDGIPDFCQNGQEICDGVPAICRVDEETGYDEDFEGWNTGEVLGQNKGWGIRQAVEDGHDAHLIISDVGAPHENVLKIVAGEGDSWMTLSPSLDLPDWTCDAENHDPRCGIHVDPTVWGAFAIEMDVQIPNEGAVAEFDLFVRTACEADAFVAKRVRLHLTQNDGLDDRFAEEGYIYVESDKPGMDDPPVVKRGLAWWASYSKGTWFHIRLIINEAANYEVLPDVRDIPQCEWTWEADDCRLQQEANITKIHSALFPQLNRTPFESRGIQLGFQTRNHADILVDNISIEPTTACDLLVEEFCDAIDQVCCCKYSRFQCFAPACGNGYQECGEECDSGPSPTCDCDSCQIVVHCGNQVVEPDCGEECDPPDGQTCDDNCHNMNGGNIG